MGVIELLKASFEAARKLGSLEVQQKLLEAQQGALDLLDENRSLKEDNAELNRRLKTRGALRFHSNMYWIAGEDGIEEGPYCSGCYDTHGQLIRLHEVDGRLFGCLGCGVVRGKDGSPAAGADAARFNRDRAMGRPSGGRRSGP